MKKKETLAKLKDKVEKQLAVSSVFKEVSAVVRKSVVTLHNDWEISLFLSCEASSSSLPPSTTAPSLPPSVSRFYTDGWGEGEVGETWCGCGFEGAIGCRSCEVMIDMGQVGVFFCFLFDLCFALLCFVLLCFAFTIAL